MLRGKRKADSKSPLSLFSDVAALAKSDEQHPAKKVLTSLPKTGGALPAFSPRFPRSDSSGSQVSAGMPTYTPALRSRNSHGPSLSFGGDSSASPSGDWRSLVSIEERSKARTVMKDAYRNNITTYDELLELVAAIDEELVFAYTSSRMQYFKAAISWDSKVKIKSNQISGKGLLPSKHPSKSKSSSPPSAPSTPASLPKSESSAAKEKVKKVSSEALHTTKTET